MTRTLIDLDDDQIRAVDEIAAAEKRSRASLIRQAVTELLGRARRSREKDAFGLWGDHKIDGLEYERKLLAEW